MCWFTPKLSFLYYIYFSYVTDKDIDDELILIKGENVHMKEEEPELQHEASFFSEMGGAYRQGDKRSLSPSSHDMGPGFKEQWPDGEANKSVNDKIMNCLDLCKYLGKYLFYLQDNL